MFFFLQKTAAAEKTMTDYGYESEKDPKTVLHEAENLRRTAFFGVAIGTA
jgi:hypothetical protein